MHPANEKLLPEEKRPQDGIYAYKRENK